MNLLTIIFIAVGLAMDAFAVSIASGLTIKQLKINHALRIALYFGAFQAIMPVVGWLAGFSLRDFIAGVDHWIAFGLLVVIGCRMVYASRKSSMEKREIDPLNIYLILLLSIATSIDALVVGLSLAFLKLEIITPALIIGIVAFLFSFIGVFIGNRFGSLYGKKVEAIGGLILITIGIKILIEHLI